MYKENCSHFFRFFLRVEDIDTMFERYIDSLLRSAGSMRFVVNPYKVPTVESSKKAFFDRLKSIPRLAALADVIPIGNGSTLKKERFFVLFSGVRTAEKREAILECVHEYRSTCIKRNLKYIDLINATTVADKIRLIQEHPCIVQVMYEQLFHIFKKNDIRYNMSDFGIGENAEFRYETFYGEDHGNILI